MRPIWTTIVAAVLAATFTGCTDPPADVEQTDPDIVGTWAANTPDEMPLIMFADDGTWTMPTGGLEFSGTYTMEGDVIRGSAEFFHGSATGETMVLTTLDGEQMHFARKSRTVAPAETPSGQQEFPDLEKLSHVMLDLREPAYLVATGVPTGTIEKQMIKLRETEASDEAIELLEWESFKPIAISRLTERILHDDYGMKNRLAQFLFGVQNRAGGPIGLTWNGGIAITARDYEHAKKTHAAYEAEPEAYRTKPKLDQRSDPVHPDNHLPFLMMEIRIPEGDRLHAAAEAGNLAEVTRLVEAGMDVNSDGSRRSTPLYMAAGNGHVEVAEFLIANGARVKDIKEYDNTDLHAAASGGHLKMVELLLRKGAILDARTGGSWNRGRTPLHEAAEGGHAEVAALLITKGADVNARGMDEKTPIFDAAGVDDAATAELLIRNGASVHARSDYGTTPLHKAARRPTTAVAKLLIRNGAEVNARSRADGERPLHLAVRHGSTAMAKLLTSNGADVNARSDGGQTPLHCPTTASDATLAVFLIDKGAKINAADAFGETPLHAQARHGSAAVVALLITKGAEIDARNKFGESPLHRAALGGHVAVVEMLIGKGAAVEAKTKDGFTPLDYAKQKDHKEVVALLEKSGAGNS